MCKTVKSESSTFCYTDISVSYRFLDDQECPERHWLGDVLSRVF